MGLLIFFSILFVIIILHELGHLLLAKKYGVLVKTYSVGFGPRIIGIKFYKGKASIRIGNGTPTNVDIWFRKDNTEYRIAPIPFGGFCDIEGEVKSTGKSYELASKPFGQKVIIALAGVGFNFITGFLVILGLCIKNYGFIIGIKNALIMVYQTIVSLFLGLYLLCTNQIPMTKAGEVNHIMAGFSLEYILIYFGVFSILMAICNAIPFPALDGSLPFLWLIEKVFGKKSNEVTQLIWFIGFAILMVVQVVIFYYWVF
jgi:membrane-associated protease RseP (regulator of RpoE activity)